MEGRQEWGPCFDAAETLINRMRDDGQPVWLDRAVDEIFRDHPDCGVPREVLRDIVRDLVIEMRWSLVA